MGNGVRLLDCCITWSCVRIVTYLPVSCSVVLVAAVKYASLQWCLPLLHSLYIISVLLHCTSPPSLHLCMMRVLLASSWWHMYSWIHVERFLVLLNGSSSIPYMLQHTCASPSSLGDHSSWQGLSWKTWSWQLLVRFSMMLLAISPHRIYKLGLSVIVLSLSCLQACMV